MLSVFMLSVAAQRKQDKQVKKKQSKEEFFFPHWKNFFCPTSLQQPSD
jgi:hypothetical protein